MKNRGFYVLLTITFLFIGFAAGLFVGRNFHAAPVQVASLPSDSSAEAAINSTTSTQDSQKASTGKVNINTASAAELAVLPGLGEVIAQRIVDYRTEHGNFESVASLIYVEGIGQKRLEAILEYITVGG